MTLFTLVKEHFPKASTLHTHIQKRADSSALKRHSVRVKAVFFYKDSETQTSLRVQIEAKSSDFALAGKLQI